MRSVNRILIGAVGVALVVALLHLVDALPLREVVREQQPSGQVTDEVRGLCPPKADYTSDLVVRLATQSLPDIAPVHFNDPVLEATFSSESRKIVFPHRKDQGSRSLYLISPYYSNEAERLTFSRQSDFFPSWSPDGEEVAFTRSEGNRASSIFVVAVETRTERRVTTPPAGFRDKFAIWTPNGEKLAFIREDVRESPLGSDQLFLVNADGSALREIHLGVGHYEVDILPVWSLDQETMVFAVRKAKDVEIARLGAYLTREFNDEAFLIKADANGQNQVVLAQHPVSSVGRFESARFSEDGSEVLYESINTEGRGEIAYVNLESGERQDTTQSCAKAD
jgi:Tol biopolymer transport system component